MDTPFRPLFKVPWFGDGTSDHCDPSNCTISVRFTRSASPASPTAHHSSADTKEASVNSPPETGAATRLSEPHVEAAVRPVPAPRAPDTTSQPGQVLAAVAAAPAAATPATKLRRDTGAGLCPPCSRSCSLALSATAPPKNAYDPQSPYFAAVPLDAGHETAVIHALPPRCTTSIWPLRAL